MKCLIVAVAACATLATSTVEGRDLPEHINLFTRKQAAQQTNSLTQARMLGALLYTNVSASFDKTPARDAINYIRTVSGVNITGRYANGRGDRGIDAETEISLDVSNEPALTVLETILEQCAANIGEACTWQLRRGFVEVGTKDRLAMAKTLRYYPIRDLLFEPPTFDNAPSLDLNSALNQGGAGGYGGGGSGGGGYGGSGGGGSSGGAPLFPPPHDETQRLTEQEKTDRLIDLIRELVEPEGWAARGGDWCTIGAYQGVLIVRAPDFVHRQIGRYPLAIRPRGAVVKQAAETRLVTFTGDLSRAALTSSPASVPDMTGQGSGSDAE